MEYKMKCNVCGKVFCYTDEDLKKNTSNAGMAALSAIGGLASALGGGTVFHTHHLQGQSDRYNDKVIDYSQCPYCHSRSLSAFTGNAEEDTKVVKTVNINTSASTESLLKRVFIFLEDGEWETADAYCEACLDKDPESAKAYLGKLMAELHVKIQEELKNQEKPFDSNANYRKAIRYGDDELRNTLVGYTEYINNRNENARKDKVLRDAKSKMTGTAVSNYDEALSLFATIPGWKDADEQKSICISKIAELKAKEEADRLERERLAEIERTKAAEKAKKNKKLAAIIVPVLAVLIVVAVIISNSVKKSNTYKNALILLEAGKHDEAIAAFESLGNYKDAAEYLEKYQKAYVVVCEKSARLSINYEYRKGLLVKETVTGNDNYDEYYYQGFTFDHNDTAYTEYEYDADGNIVKITVYSSSGSVFQTTTRTYDNQENIVLETVGDKNGVFDTITYTYDNNGNLIHQLRCSIYMPEEFASRTNYEYDEYNRLIEETQVLLGGQEEIGGGVFTFSYVYDENNRLIKDIYSSDDFSRTYEYTYNAAGDIAEKIYTINNDNGSSVISHDIYDYDYDEFGNVTKKTYYDLLEQVATKYVTEYTYDYVYLTYLME